MSSGPNVSAETPAKLEQYSEIQWTHLRVTQAILKKNAWTHPEYVHCDLNAGCGVYPGPNGAPLRGSPLVFTEMAERLQLPYRAWFFEKNERCMAGLIEHHRAISCRHGETSFVVGDHNVTASRVATEIGGLSFREGKVYGLIYADPNGEVLPFGAIRSLLADGRRTKIDVLAYVAATNHKRAVGAGYVETRLIDALAGLGKRYLWLRVPRGAFQWTFALLSNWDQMPGFEHLEFRRVGTPEGDELADWLNFSEGDRRKLEALRSRPFPDRPTGRTRSISAIQGSLPFEQPSCDEPAVAASSVGPTGRRRSIT